MVLFVQPTFALVDVIFGGFTAVQQINQARKKPASITLTGFIVRR